ncbi:Hypothetical_protein [Hexamita inflata]|uniref:Hypothetical_protein n=1 Tax=Hexamita inflata TaxID=28002 RepID=A0AA86PUI3_9EUKA|nr:Hypothetical protein HINF_LOCUS34129 [Hexamita inflata]
MLTPLKKITQRQEMFDNKSCNFVKVWGEVDKSTINEHLIDLQLKEYYTPKPETLPREHLLYNPHDDNSVRYFLHTKESASDILFKRKQLKNQYFNKLKREEIKDIPIQSVSQEQEKIQEYIPSPSLSNSSLVNNSSLCLSNCSGVDVYRSKSQLIKPIVKRTYGFLKKDHTEITQ